MDQNSFSQMESSTQIYQIIPSNYDHHFPIKIYEVLRQDPKLITFNVYAYKNGLKPIVPIQTLGKLVGSGGYGQVYKVKHNTQKFECALKIMSKCELEGIYILVKEFQIQQYIGEHYPQCIIQLRNKIAISQQQINEYTIQAYLDIAEYSLWEIIKKKKKLSEAEINEIFDQILDSILNLHSLNISHGDIKPQNILFEKEKGWVLADFGCAIRYSQPFGKYILGGTKAFFPLDLRQKILNLENLENFYIYMNLFIKDIYAFQLTILILLYPEKKIIELQKILDGKQPIHYLVDSLYNKNYITLKQWFKSRKYQRKNQETKEVMSNHHINQLKKQVISEKQTYQNKSLFEQPLVIGNFQLYQNFELQQFEQRKDFDQKYKYNISKQLQLCKDFLKFKRDDKQFQFYQAKLEFVLGNFSNSKQIMNNLNDFDYMENDEQFLQFQILKARLNGYWWKISDKIINSLQNLVNLNNLNAQPDNIEWDFLLMGQTREIIHIKATRNDREIQRVNLIINRDKLQEDFIDHCWEIFMYCNTFLKMPSSLSGAIQIIEENFPNYYFNWMIYYLDAVYNIIKDKHQEAKSSALKAFSCIKDESCIVNKFRIQFLLWITYLNLEEVDDCNKTFTYILNQAQLEDAPQLFQEYFSYFSEELLSDKTIQRSIGFFKDILEKIFLTQENLINDNELNLFFFQMLSKYYILEKNSAKIQQLINSSLISFYQNNPNKDQTVVEIFDYMVFSQFRRENYNKNLRDLQKLQQIKFIVIDLDLKKMDNQIINEKFEFSILPSGKSFILRFNNQIKFFENASNLRDIQISLQVMNQKKCFI